MANQNPSNNSLQSQNVYISKAMNQCPQCQLGIVLGVDSLGGVFEYKDYVNFYISDFEHAWVDEMLMSVVYLRNRVGLFYFYKIWIFLTNSLLLAVLP